MNSAKPILLELHYFPTISYFSKFFLGNPVVIEQQENFVKRSFRNRMHIASANGLLRLSIPLVKGKNQGLNIRSVKISYDENWQHKHWTAICSAYGNAPFFEYYVDDLAPLFKEKTTYLFEHNLKVLNTLCFVLDVSVEFSFSETFLPIYPPNFLDFRNRITPKTIGSNGDETYQEVPYQQVFAEKTGYLPNLSILDMIFCKGPETMSLLKAALVTD